MNLRKIRKNLGMTQREFAETLGVHWITVNRWENGKSNPSPLATEGIRLAEAASLKHRAKNWRREIKERKHR